MAAQNVTVDLRQIDGAAFAAKGASGHWVTMDAPAELGGHDAGSRPLELFLMGLAGCTAVDVVAMLRKMRAPLEDFRIEARAERGDEHPQVFTKVELLYHFWGRVDPAQAQRAIGLSHKTYCSASAMLKPRVTIEHHFIIHHETPAPEASA